MSMSGSHATMDPWDQFTDNLATDLAPFISLFGERLSKQFLSESVSLLDNFIFALAPLGILTALVSVVRVCGTSSLRAFVGRAQEGPGEAESELLSCVSETTGELFNDNGISRIFGRPRILEVVVWEDYDPLSKQSYWKIGTLRDALQQGAWVPGDGSWILDEKDYLPELDIPNLSLNKGIERRSPFWFYSAAALGLVLQVGVIMYGALTVFIYPGRFKKDGQPVESYAFPLFLFGTLSLCTGMFFCAFIIERSSSECYLHAEKPSKLYWLQPGRQHVGDQVFEAFLGVTEGSDSQATDDMTYIKSVRSRRQPGKSSLFLIATVTTIGFIAQFVGLRGLHATVILAQLGATLIMAIVRTCLRTKRIGPEQNRFDGQERQLMSHKRQELDSFAFHLENMKSFGLVSTLTRTPPSSYQSSLLSTATIDSSVQTVGNATRLIQTRARLAELTLGNDRKPKAWNDLPIRQIARSLAGAIETAMELLSTWKNDRNDSFSFDLSLLCQSHHKSIAPMLETYTITLERADDSLQWRVDRNELEAIVGLWTWSMLKSDPKWLQEGLGRIVGLSESEARAPETDLYFHKWIFRQTEARMVSSKMIALPQQMFGYYSDEYPDDKEILVVRTKNKLEKMVAQDIYIQFFRSALEGLGELGGDTNILPSSHSRLVAHNSHLDNLVECFEFSGLGSREDALLCIVPTLKNRGLLPELAADSCFMREHLYQLVGSNKWSEAFSIAYWLCERCGGKEFEYSIHELGYLCHLAMIHRDGNVQAEALRYVKLAMQGDPRTLFFENMKNQRPPNWVGTPEQRVFWSNFTDQLKWMVWHISDKNTQNQSIRTAVSQLGINEDSLIGANGSDGQPQKGMETAIRLLTTDDESQVLGVDDRLALDWACQYSQHAILGWLIAKWVEFDNRCRAGFIFNYIIWSAEGKYRIALDLLKRRGVNLDMQGPLNGMAPIVYAITESNHIAVHELLDAGADVDVRGPTMETPLMIACDIGCRSIILLLLQYGAKVNTQNVTGMGSLMACAAAGHVDVARTLLDHGADVNLKNSEGCTSMMAAAAEDEVELMQLLYSRGADIDAQNNSGHTALIWAAQNRCTKAMELLLGYGADVHRQTCDGETAWDWVRMKYSPDEVQWLGSKWADRGSRIDSH
ncbi:hypothetical protein BDV59DRAFT_49061 [Aspergillus ambiguus]|uniref:ankyrin repeat domain-containing protein n=1 Tax=Aspergillus ambiguus TaxID=176160 RepID=UPI003CCD2FBF